jgi:hypothetical protein
MAKHSILHNLSVMRPTFIFGFQEEPNCATVAVALSPAIP